VRKAWHDPVWSKVIAAGIIAAIGAASIWWPTIRAFLFRAISVPG
jgi:hypothetical protein